MYECKKNWWTTIVKLFVEIYQNLFWCICVECEMTESTIFFNNNLFFETYYTYTDLFVTKNLHYIDDCYACICK